jgi:hypothetical protein
MKALNIKNYQVDGFVKVCDVARDSDNRWYYTDINESAMFADHKSWVYFIVVDNEIVKVGETGNPLGVRMKTSNQPEMSTRGRFGRYRGGFETDAVIREELKNEVRKGQVQLWSRRCEMVTVSTSVCGHEDVTVTSFHKDLEMRYLDYIFTQTGNLPRLNKARK